MADANFVISLFSVPPSGVHWSVYLSPLATIGAIVGTWAGTQYIAKKQREETKAESDKLREETKAETVKLREEVKAETIKLREEAKAEIVAQRLAAKVQANQLWLIEFRRNVIPLILQIRLDIISLNKTLDVIYHDLGLSIHKKDLEATRTFYKISNQFHHIIAELHCLSFISGDEVHKSILYKLNECVEQFNKIDTSIDRNEATTNGEIDKVRDKIDELTLRILSISQA